jgi:uncharacterized protein YjbI with pentapeptide repeats
MEERMFEWFMGLGVTWITVIVLGSVMLGGAIWYVLPILMVRRHGLEDADAARHEDNARKTVGSAITSLAVSVPFALGAAQWMYTQSFEQQKSIREYSHETTKQFSESLSRFVEAKDKDRFELRIQGIYDLERTAVEITTRLSANVPPEHFIIPVADLLKRLIGENARIDSTPIIPARRGCDEKVDDKSFRRRNDKDYIVQAAFGSLGRLRAIVEFPMQFDELQFDNIDVSRRTDGKIIEQSYVGSHYIGAYLRRVNFSRANFAKANFSEAHFADTEIPQPQAKSDDANETGEWKKYRCKSANFRGAILVDADFRDAKLQGADFGGADLKDAKFHGANISRADFTDSKNLTKEQLCLATWDRDSMPKTGFDSELTKCAK